MCHNWFSDGGDPAEVWVATAAQRGLTLKLDEVQRALAETNRELASLVYSYLGRTSEYWKRHDERVMDLLGIREGRDSLASHLDRWFEENEVGELYSDVIPALKFVERQELRMGVISNHTERLLRILDRLRIRSYFDSVTFSQEAGAEKPETPIFALALQRMQCAPEGAIFVGDSWNADVTGARRVGIRPIWLNRRGDPTPGPCDRIHGLSELPGLLAHESDQRPE